MLQTFSYRVKPFANNYQHTINSADIHSYVVGNLKQEKLYFMSHTIGIIGKSNGELIISKPIAAGTEIFELWNEFSYGVPSVDLLYLYPDNDSQNDGFDFKGNENLIQQYHLKSDSIDKLNNMLISYQKRMAAYPEHKEAWQIDVNLVNDLLSIINSVRFSGVDQLAFITISY